MCFEDDAARRVLLLKMHPIISYPFVRCRVVDVLGRNWQSHWLAGFLCVFPHESCSVDALLIVVVYFVCDFVAFGLCPFSV